VNDFRAGSGPGASIDPRQAKQLESQRQQIEDQQIAIDELRREVRLRGQPTGRLPSSNRRCIHAAQLNAEAMR